MNLENCFICKHLVLELVGQFEKLDTYLLEEDDLAYQQSAFGWCHTSCLSKSQWGAFWAQRRMWHLTSIMGFSKLHNDVALTLLCNPSMDERLVLRADGLLHFNKALKGEWVSNWVSADVSYSQFIPKEVLELVLST